MPRAPSKQAASTPKADHLSLPAISASTSAGSATSPIHSPRADLSSSPRPSPRPGADPRPGTANLRQSARPNTASFRPSTSPDPGGLTPRPRPGSALPRTSEAPKRRGRKHRKRNSSLGDLPTFAGLASEVAGIADALERSLDDLQHAENDNLEADRKKVARQTLSTDSMYAGRIKLLAQKHGLDLTEMEWVMQCLKNSDINQSDGGMTLDSFEQFILRAFQIPEADHRIIANAYITLNADVGAFDMDEFFVWYKQNAFAISGGAAKFTRRASENAVDALAKQLGVNSVEMVRLRRQYKQYDSDNSGAICFEEFHSLLKQILGMSASDSIQKDRIERFWAEANPDGDSKIDFQEFVCWYIHYFKTSFKKDRASMNDPATEFYNSFLPQVQRRKALEKRNQEGREPDALEERATSSVVQASSQHVSKVPPDGSLQPHPPTSPSGGRPHRRPHAPDAMSASRPR